MPPQSYNPSPQTSSSDRDRQPMPAEQRHRSHREGSSSKGRSSSSRILGDYTLSKTLGAGSMGKVKLAVHNITDEKLAVKILPRVHPSTTPPNGTNATPEAIAKQASKDASKEIRTLREAALSMLLHHPYICGMREMIVHQHHYYMVFEYVNGGQMLDYIISHGRLRERVARKFARQIGSALDYCHRNSVVHRDLKIENILISETGNIKIIDFGLSNLFNPADHLATFCGSLYFAAPELLNAKVYTGPEVDVWSFGVVLYVLVCGKVPFDDQSMPALHAKIKRGFVEYPVWLSAECKHLLSRMLVTNPLARASLTEVLEHPWMVRGFTGPPDSHLVHREPLRADELDRQVIRGMKGFEFGTEEEIERKLIGVLESDAYIRAVQAWDRKKYGRSGSGSGSGRWGESFSNSSLAISFDGTHGHKDSAPLTATPSKKNKRFSGFDFYRRKLFSPSTSPNTTPSHSPPTSSSHLSVADGAREPADPTLGFHPLLSMYYLAREKLERERVYGPGHFASSQLSIASNGPPTAGAVEDTAVPLPYSSKAPSQPQMQTQPGKKDTVRNGEGPLPASVSAKADYSMPLPRLPAPQTSHYSGMSYDAAAAPSPTATTFHGQPRARDAGLPSVPPAVAVAAGPVRQDIVGASPSPAGAQPTMPVTPTTTAAGATTLPRAPPASTHRRSHSMSQRPTVLRGLGGMFGGGGEAPLEEEAVPHTAGPDVGGFGDMGGDSNRDREKGASPDEEGRTHEGVAAGAATLVRKFGTLLVGGDSRRGHGSVGKRSTILGTPRASAEHESEAEKKELSTPTTNGVNKASAEEPRPDVDSRRSSTISPQPISASQSQPLSTVHRRAATILDPQGRAIRHERRSSTGGALLPSFGGTIGRHRRPSTGYGMGGGRGVFGRTEEVEEVEGELGGGREGRESGGPGREGKEETFKDRQEAHQADKDFKPVHLKGLFSVATTSTKPPSVLKGDIRKVLDRMQVQYREIKGGFECIHIPSIVPDSTNINTIAQAQSRPSQHRRKSSTGSNDTGKTPRSLVKKASKLSFGVKTRERERERDKERESIKERDQDPSQPIPSQVQDQPQSQPNKDLSRRPSVGAALSATPSSGSSSFFNVSSNAHTVLADGSRPPPSEIDAASERPETPQMLDELDAGNDSTMRSPSPVKVKVLPPIPRDFTSTPQPQLDAQAQAPVRPMPFPTGEVDRELFETMGANSLSVRFEINIIKVPWLPLHGIQFRRAGGDGWQYQMLARRVLTELKL
ncbi:hypothetical protein BJ138DRAFT_1016529 [Hygrophoropsis aurantiaca]|uniref:Uncharacterized protein n=1 Tax=Hygrophoropsis aurantiaca TaxID=72124 RepID=A0ACB7ZZN8_9AGAM|nr:hypothetical protein BJ138DRAFT_1016529 [Hygrophoropsis aurantiaca]